MNSRASMVDRPDSAAAPAVWPWGVFCDRAYTAFRIKDEFDHALNLSGEEIDHGIIGMVRLWRAKR